MTREEAREALSVLKICDAQWLREAVDMAIEALQTIDNCDQCEWCCPSDGTPTIHVVRCKDCRHRDLFSCPLAENDFQKDDDFCSWGERKEPLPQYAEWKEPFEKMTESAKVGDNE